MSPFVQIWFGEPHGDDAPNRFVFLDVLMELRQHAVSEQQKLNLPQVAVVL